MSASSSAARPMTGPTLSRRGVLKIGAVGLAPVLLPSMAHGGTPAEIPDYLRKRWEERYPGKPGGLSLNMMTPQGSFFASTLEGVTSGSHFRAASTTKTFTAAAIMLLDQRGMLRIDDKISGTMPGKTGPYLPDSPDYAIPYKDQITIRLLLSHRAGVFDLENQEVPPGSGQPYGGRIYHEWREEQDERHSFTKRETIEVLARNRLSNAAPGASYHYSDCHYQILGEIVEQVSGLSLNDFVSQELLKPNGLSHSHFVTDGTDQTLPSPFIEGFVQYKGQLFPATNYNYSYDPGSGNLVTTLDDLTRWMRLLIRGETALNPGQVARMCDVMPDSHYGLGLKHWTKNGDELGYGHDGGTAGYLTNAYHDPKTDVSFVMQCSLLDYDGDPDPLTSVMRQADWLGGISLHVRNRLLS